MMYSLDLERYKLIKELKLLTDRGGLRKTHSYLLMYDGFQKDNFWICSGNIRSVVAAL